MLCPAMPSWAMPTMGKFQLQHARCALSIVRHNMGRWHLEPHWMTSTYTCTAWLQERCSTPLLCLLPSPLPQFEGILLIPVALLEQVVVLQGRDPTTGQLVRIVGTDAR